MTLTQALCQTVNNHKARQFLCPVSQVISGTTHTGPAHSKLPVFPNRNQKELYQFGGRGVSEKEIHPEIVHTNQMQGQLSIKTGTEVHI